MREPDPPDVGAHVRTWRQRRSMSLRTLASACNLSPNTISLIERGMTSPSVSTLHQLATALQVPITAFFQEGIEKVELIASRAGQRPRTGNARVQLESLGSGLVDQILESFQVTLSPGADSGEQSITHAGHELVYCLQGELEYTVSGRIHVLAPGDALLFEARLPHSWCNRRSKPVVFLLIFEADGQTVSVQHMQVSDRSTRDSV
jgi:transcriptional regulator with XRE-family HTH domain